MTVVLEATRVGRAAREAVVIDEGVPLGRAWQQLHADPDRCGLIVRDRMPIAVITAGDVAERWPGLGPLCSWARPAGAVLDRPLGVEILEAQDDVEHAARRLLASGLLAPPVTAAEPGGPWRLLGPVSALLDGRTRP